LNNFLLNDAKIYLEEIFAKTLIWYDNNEIIAYASVSNDSVKIEKDKVSDKLGDNEPPFSSFPAVKIGRLAVTENYQGKKFGQKIMDFFKLFFLIRNKTGCRFIIVDAYLKAIDFYKKNGFIFLSNSDKSNQHTRKMFFDLKVHLDNLKKFDDFSKIEEIFIKNFSNFII